MSEFVRWETPFTETEYPSVVVMTTRGEKGEYLVEAVVAPTGINKYPKYLVEFGEVVGFSSMEEMHFPDHDFRDAKITEERLCAYRILDSPWLESYNNGEYFLFNIDGGHSEKLSHFVIFGGDDFLQVVTKNEPKIMVVNEPTVRTIEFPF
ncbi:MAG: hypothetical protein ACKVRN_14115 [Pyrinomonadaceae bacterium]